MVSHTDDMELSDELEEDELSADLKEAIQANDFDRLEAALDVRPSVSQEKLDECLKAAMPEASTDIIRLLLQRGAKLQMWSYGQAITRSEPEVFQLLMDHGWDIDSTEFGRPAVLIALGQPELLRWLLEHGASPDTSSQGSCTQSRTPLASAAGFRSSTALKMLLSFGTKIDPRAIFSAIGHRYCSENGTENLKILIEHGADVNYRAPPWGTPLIHAVSRNKKEKLQILLDNGADPSFRLPGRDITAADIARSLNRMDLCRILEEPQTGRAP